MTQATKKTKVKYLKKKRMSVFDNSSSKTTKRLKFKPKKSHESTAISELLELNAQKLDRMLKNDEKRMKTDKAKV